MVYGDFTCKHNVEYIVDGQQLLIMINEKRRIAVMFVCNANVVREQLFKLGFENVRALFIFRHFGAVTSLRFIQKRE